MRFLSLVFICSVGAAALNAAADTVLQENIPPSATRVTVSLDAELLRDQGYSGGGSGISPTSIPERLRSVALPGEEYYWNLGNQLGAAAFMLGRTLPDLRLLGKTDKDLYRVRIFRERSGEFDELSSGTLLTNGNNIEIPVALDCPPLGQNHLQNIPASINLSVYESNNRPAVNPGSKIAVQLSGSTLLPASKLTVTLDSLTTTTADKAQGIKLRIEPFDNTIPPRLINGKLSDVHDLRGAKMVVEKVASDFSKVTLAIVDGDLAAAEKYQAQVVSALPAMAQVELFDRKLVTAKELMDAAAGRPGILMIFGDFKDESPSPGFGYYPGGGRTTVLPMNENTILETLRDGKSDAETPLVVFVVRQISVKKLLEDYIGKRPPFAVIADYVDPLRTTFRSNRDNPGGYYSYGDQTAQNATLRNSMGLPDGKVSVVLTDRAGKVLYSKADAGDDLRTPLADALRTLTEKK
jgi:hypothetical protein